MQGPLRESVVVDVDLQYGGPCAMELSERKDSFDGVIVTNVTGALADVEFYEKWCKENQKILLFDNAAVAIGDVRGRCIHDFGDGAIVSLHETKPIGRGEGGAIIVSSHLENIALRTMNFGFYPGGQVHSRLGSNWKISEIASAAILDHLDNVKGQNWVGKYDERLKFVNQILSKYNLHHFQEPRYPSLMGSLRVSLPEGIMSRDVCQMLNALTPFVEARVYYRPLDEMELVPRSWEVYNTTVCLPFHLDLSKDQIKYMIEQLAQVCKSFRSKSRGAASCDNPSM